MRTLLVSVDLTADEIPATGGHRRFVPGPAVADVTSCGDQADFPQLLVETGIRPAWRRVLSGTAAFSRRTGAQSAPGKGKGMPLGKARFPQGHSLTFSCARKPQTFRSPCLTGGGCLFSPASNFANYGSRVLSTLAQVWARGAPSVSLSWYIRL